MKCLFGIYRMDAGEVILDGKKIEINKMCIRDREKSECGIK